jgi:transposase
MIHPFEERLEVVKLILSGYPLKRLCRERRYDSNRVYDWLRTYKDFGEEGLRHRKPNKKFSGKEKEELVRLYLEKGIPLRDIYYPNGISRYAFQSWIRIVRSKGYQALYTERRRRKRKMARPKKKEPQTELEKLQAENLRLRAENALLKKVKALVEEQQARARLSGQKPSTN